MKRIIIHWTAGTYTPNSQELEHYHYLIGYDPKTGKAYIKEGKCKPEDNLNCSDGKYAAHTGGGNTGSIGVALCGMLGYKSIKEVGNYPLTEAQFNLCYNLCAKMTKKYSISIAQTTVMTHYEFGKKNPNTASRGKIDIVCIPYLPHVSCGNIGDYIRERIRMKL